MQRQMQSLTSQVIVCVCGGGGGGWTSAVPEPVSTADGDTEHAETDAESDLSGNGQVRVGGYKDRWVMG